MAARDIPPSLLEELYCRFREHAKWIRAPQHDADDIIQDCLYRLLSSNSVFADEHHLMATFNLMLRHRAIDLNRMHHAAKRAQLSAADSIAAAQAYDEDSAVESKALVRDLLATLTASEMRLAFARFYERRELREIAADEGVSITTIHRRLQRIFIKLAGLDAREE